MRFAVVFRLFLLAVLPLSFSTCALLMDEAKKKEGICIHGLTRTTYGSSGCTGSTTSVVYTFCTDEKKSDDCTNLSITCGGSVNYSDDDTITYYDDGKRCDTSGYTITCSSNSRYKAADSSFCPP